MENLIILFRFWLANVYTKKSRDDDFTQVKHVKIQGKNEGVDGNRCVNKLCLNYVDVLNPKINLQL
jgi:hypothetical protein